ncbi:haloacid dehalogenase [Bosea sp. (in: a-proteobacteria)]|uniref:haloacid dehalogenase n=1 Tax=Bosea sp. (in: a-proteobacteria) TaxID=1871050 RepID=UPI003B3B1724
MTARIHSIWLLPTASDEVLLTGIVKELSGRFGTPIFAPHLTVLGDSEMTADALAHAIETAAQEVSAFAEAVNAVETSEAYFRSFYARFPVATPLIRLKQALDPQGLEGFMPHVSLLYGPVEAAAKAQAAREIGERLTGRSIRFDRLCVVTSGQEVAIADWRVVVTAPLGEG